MKAGQRLPCEYGTSDAGSHNIDADGWAGAYNSHCAPSHPMLAHTHAQTIITAALKLGVFTLFNLIITDRKKAEKSHDS